MTYLEKYPYITSDIHIVLWVIILGPIVSLGEFVESLINQIPLYLI